MYNQNKTLYNMNIKHIKISIFAAFQQQYLSTLYLCLFYNTWERVISLS